MRNSSCFFMALCLSVFASCSRTERAQTPKDEQPTQDKSVAVLEAEFRAPTNAEAKRFELYFRQGQIVESILSNGNADAAGIRQGDVILKLDENAISSKDAILDFLRLTEPGNKVRVQLKREESLKTEEVLVELGTRVLDADEASTSNFTWDFAGLAQLDQALERAKKQNKLVLVGLSGAET